MLKYPTVYRVVGAGEPRGVPGGDGEEAKGTRRIRSRGRYTYTLDFKDI